MKIERERTVNINSLINNKIAIRVIRKHVRTVTLTCCQNLSISNSILEKKGIDIDIIDGVKYRKNIDTFASIYRYR